MTFRATPSTAWSAVVTARLAIAPPAARRAHPCRSLDLQLVRQEQKRCHHQQRLPRVASGGSRPTAGRRRIRRMPQRPSFGSAFIGCRYVPTKSNTLPAIAHVAPILLSLRYIILLFVALLLCVLRSNAKSVSERIWQMSHNMKPNAENVSRTLISQPSSPRGCETLPEI